MLTRGRITIDHGPWTIDHRDNYSLEEGNYRWECVSVSVCCVSGPPLRSDLLLPWSAGKEQGRPWGAAWMAAWAG